MAEEITNGDFETGDMTGWSGRNAWVAAYQPYEGTYQAIIIDQDTFNGGELWQDVDFTNVATLSYYARSELETTCYVKIDGSVVQSESALSSWAYYEIDVSGYSGVKTLEFSVVDEYDLQLDLISAESSDGGLAKINIGDTWKIATAMKINIGDSWKDVVSVKQNIGDAWKTVF